MTSRRFDIVSLLSFGLLCLSPDAQAQELRVIEHFPAARVIIEGQGIGFLVRFDRPVDHIHSFLVITRGGTVVRLLHPRLEAAPDVLFARTSILKPGDYRLHWIVQPMTSLGLGQNGMPFTVREPRPKQPTQTDVQSRNGGPVSKEPTPAMAHAAH